ncbi:MAG: hypothetical protein AAGA83_03955 [Cyanobacteria bacterium P01_F01_bin.116]
MPAAQLANEGMHRRARISRNVVPSDAATWTQGAADLLSLTGKMGISANVGADVDETSVLQQVNTNAMFIPGIAGGVAKAVRGVQKFNEGENWAAKQEGVFHGIDGAGQIIRAFPESVKGGIQANSGVRDIGGDSFWGKFRNIGMLTSHITNTLFDISSGVTAIYAFYKDRNESDTVAKIDQTLAVLQAVASGVDNGYWVDSDIGAVKDSFGDDSITPEFYAEKARNAEIGGIVEAIIGLIRTGIGVGRSCRAKLALGNVALPPIEGVDGAVDALEMERDAWRTAETTLRQVHNQRLRGAAFKGFAGLIKIAGRAVTIARGSIGWIMGLSGVQSATSLAGWVDDYRGRVEDTDKAAVANVLYDVARSAYRPNENGSDGRFDNVEINLTVTGDEERGNENISISSGQLLQSVEITPELWAKWLARFGRGEGNVDADAIRQQIQSRL